MNYVIAKIGNSQFQVYCPNGHEFSTAEEVAENLGLTSTDDWLEFDAESSFSPLEVSFSSCFDLNSGTVSFNLTKAKAIIKRKITQAFEETITPSSPLPLLALIAQASLDSSARDSTMQTQLDEVNTNISNFATKLSTLDSATTLADAVSVIDGYVTPSEYP